jgi:hypothetical protein
MYRHLEVFFGITHIVCSTVIPNRGAVTHKGAVKRCLGCRQMFNLLIFMCFTTWGATYCHFLPGKGAAKYFLVPKGAVSQKRLKNTGVVSCQDWATRWRDKCDKIDVDN